MERIFSNRNISFVILVLSVFSCSSDLDFEQTKDFNAQPVITLNLAYIQREAPDFVENGIELPPLSHTTTVGFFDSSLVNDHLVKAELYIRIKNTINRAFTFDIDLKDDNDALVKNIKIEVPASVDGSEKLVDPIIVFEGSEVDELRSTTQMVFTVSTDPAGPPLSEVSKGRVELSSSITAYFDVK
jgi:hypothetical protein